MKRWQLFTFIIVIGVVSLVTLIVSMRVGYVANAQQLNESRSLIKQLLATPLQLGNRTVLGDPKSDITMVEVVDFTNPKSAEQYRKVVPFLLREYVKTGVATLSHAYTLSKEEYTTKTGRFKYAAAALCFPMTGNITQFHQKLFETKESNIPDIAAQYGIENFTRCLKKSDALLFKDMMETHLYLLIAPSLHISIRGNDDTVLIGSPSLERINKTIINKKVLLGK